MATESTMEGGEPSRSNGPRSQRRETAANRNTEKEDEVQTIIDPDECQPSTSGEKQPKARSFVKQKQQK